MKGGGSEVYCLMSEDGIGTADYFKMQIATGGGTPTSRIGYLLGSFGNATSGFTIGNSRAAPLRFLTTGVEQMRITAAGNVGIGISSPASVLHVVGVENDGSSATLKIQSNTQRMLLDGNEIDAYTTGGVSNDLYLNNNSGGNVVIATGGGKVGINVNPSTYNLEVSGTAAKTGGGSWTVLSDERMKEQVKPYSDGLQQVMQINPVTYHYNARSGYDTKAEYVGVLAQQLQPVAPYMTGTTIKNGQQYLTVDNSAMTYMLVNAVKELSKQNEELRSQNSKAKSQNEALETRVQKLEELMSKN